MSDMSMSASIAWILPVTFIPGLAILILSTINKRNHIYDIITDRMDKDNPALVPIIHIHLNRLRYIHLALTMLYAGIGSLGLSSLLGGITSELTAISMYVVLILVCLGLLFLCIAVGMLIYESSLSTKAMKQEFRLNEARMHQLIQANA